MCCFFLDLEACSIVSLCVRFFISIVSFLGTIRQDALFIKTIKQIDDVYVEIFSVVKHYVSVKRVAFIL